jgi:hypothetical protein
LKALDDLPSATARRKHRIEHVADDPGAMIQAIRLVSVRPGVVKAGSLKARASFRPSCFDSVHTSFFGGDRSGPSHHGDKISDDR